MADDQETVMRASFPGETNHLDTSLDGSKLGDGVLDLRVQRKAGAVEENMKRHAEDTASDIIDVVQPRILVVDKNLGPYGCRWTSENAVNHNVVSAVNDECRKNQPTLPLRQWTGLPAVEMRCGESKKRPLQYTLEEETVIQKPCLKVWRCAARMLDQLAIYAAGTHPQGLKQKMLHGERQS